MSGAELPAGDPWDDVRAAMATSAAADLLARRGHAGDSLSLIQQAQARLGGPTAAAHGDRPQAYQEARLALARLARARLGEALVEQEARLRRLLRRAVAGGLVVAILGIAWFVGGWVHERDLTIGARWVAASAAAGPPAATGTLAARSVFDNYPGYLFRIDNQPEPRLDIDLGAVRTVTGVSVVNRLDCCYEESRGLRVMVSRDGVQYRAVSARDGVSVWKTWRASFPPQKARFVRLALRRQGSLALSDVRVLGQ
jgi:hypothetical protein